MNRSLILAALAAAAFTAQAVQANPTIESNGRLASRDGRTLYIFDKDAPGRSNCSDGCLAAWPAFTVANAALAGGDFSIVTRADGVQQWAFKGMPLYFYAGDTRTGDVNGDNRGGVWHVINARQKSSALSYEHSFEPFSRSYSFYN